jgi:hypothetical protein
MRKAKYVFTYHMQILSGLTQYSHNTGVRTPASHSGDPQFKWDGKLVIMTEDSMVFLSSFRKMPGQ